MQSLSAPATSIAEAISGLSAVHGDFYFGQAAQSPEVA
jgi:hypothetical protein